MNLEYIEGLKASTDQSDPVNSIFSSTIQLTDEVLKTHAKLTRSSTVLDIESQNMVENML